MTEYQSLIAMLDRSGVGYSARDDADGKQAVQVEPANVGAEGQGTTDWRFDADGKLIEVVISR